MSSTDNTNNDFSNTSEIRISIRFTVVTIFMLATIFTAIVAMSLQYYFSSRLAKQHALERYQQLSKATADHIAAIDQQAQNATLLLAQLPQLIRDHRVNPLANRVFRQVMLNNPMFNAIHLGFENGDFYQLINLDAHANTRKALQASPFDRWVIITVIGTGNQRTRVYRYYNDHFNLRATRSEPSDYDATRKNWYTQAKTDIVTKSPPYLLQPFKTPGQSFSIRIPKHDVVLAVDITLSPLSQFLRNNQLGNQSEIYLYQSSGEIIASNVSSDDQDDLPDSQPMPLTAVERKRIQALKPLRISNELDWPPIDFAVAGQPYGYAIDVIDLIQQQTGIRFKFVNGYDWPSLVQQFRAGKLDALQPVFLRGENLHLGVLSEPFLDTPFYVAVPQGAPKIKSIQELRGKRVAIPSGWTIIQLLNQTYSDISIVKVSSTREALLKVSAKEVDACLDNGLILEYTARQFYIKGVDILSDIQTSKVKVDNGLRIMFQPQYADLIPIINRAIFGITEVQKQALRDKWLAVGLTQSTAKTEGTVPYPFLLEKAELDNESLTEFVYQKRHFFVYRSTIDRENNNRENNDRENKELFAVVVPAETLMKQVVDQTFLSMLGTAFVLLLLLPTSGWFASPIVNPITQLVRKSHWIQQRRYNALERNKSRISEIVDLEHALNKMAESIQQYEQAQSELMESIVRLIAQAIDDKSPFTGAHCARVPELGIMLAEAASASDEAPFHHFQFASDDEKREFRLAAWLHDCGKITTPEHIIDKGAKLETIYNRIHEVRMRFEVLWRDLDIEYLHRLAEDPQQSATLARWKHQQQEQLHRDFAFIAALNLGSESVTSKQIERLHHIAQRTWVRHFDHQIGLSPVESERYPEPPPTLPSEEPLLSDRDEHVIKRETSLILDPTLGIKMDVPEYQYNLGEIYNLSVSRGTLTKEDRFKINEHMISTIKMLDGLPFPDELKRVPRYASTHHETMKGTGYPRKLSAENLSIPERVLAVADIFEALTAADRPYKQPKKVSDALAILHRMALNNDVDWDVFKLFLTSGVFKTYSERFLPPHQLDEVDIARYLQHQPLS